ncbi:MAG: DUF4115 domain-containing protein [Cellvibrionaceae bacterium]
MSEQTATENAEAVHSPGQYMRGCREAAGLSVEDVAADLRILPSFLRFIEQDAYDKLPGETFVRGYYRAYAKLLKLDENDVTQRYSRFVGKKAIPVESKQLSNRSVEAPAQAPILTSAEAEKQSGSQFGQQKMIWIVIGVLLFGAMLTVLNEQNVSSRMVASETVSKSSDESKDLELELETSEKIELLKDQMPQEMGKATHKVDVAEGELASELDENSETSEVKKIKPTLPVSEKLLLTFSEDSWVEVTDSKGDVLLTDLLQAGSTSELDGTPPYQVFLGNGLGVKIVYQGQLVEFKPDSDKSTARVFVGE